MKDIQELIFFGKGKNAAACVSLSQKSYCTLNAVIAEEILGSLSMNTGKVNFL